MSFNLGNGWNAQRSKMLTEALLLDCKGEHLANAVSGMENALASILLEAADGNRDKAYRMLEAFRSDVVKILNGIRFEKSEPAQPNFEVRDGRVVERKVGKK